MSFGDVVGILNRLIDVVNTTAGAMSECLTDGRIDYQRIVNIPRINGVELVGDLTQAMLEIGLDAEVSQRLLVYDRRIATVEDDGAKRLKRISVLESQRKLDSEAIDELKPYMQRVKSLEDHRVNDVEKIGLLDQRYSSLHTTQTAESEKTATLQREMSEKTSNITELKERLAMTIGRTNAAYNQLLADHGKSCSLGEAMDTSKCVTDISNSFTFD